MKLFLDSLKLSKYDTQTRRKFDDKFSTENGKEATESPEIEKETKYKLEDANKHETTGTPSSDSEESITVNNVPITDKNDKTKDDMSDMMTEKELQPKEPSSVEELSDIMSSIKKQFFHNMMGEMTSKKRNTIFVCSKLSFFSFR